MGLFGRKKTRSRPEEPSQNSSRRSEEQSGSELTADEIEANNITITNVKAKPQALTKVDGDIWWCSVCTQKQQFSQAHCKTCGRFPRFTTEATVYDVHWECPVCTQANEHKCKVCGRVPILPPPVSAPVSVPLPDTPKAVAVAAPPPQADAAPAGAGGRPQPHLQQPQACAQCGQAARQGCPRCHQAFYCSPTCYQQHWPTHGPTCRPVEELFSAPAPSVSRPGTPEPLEQYPHVQAPASDPAVAAQHVQQAELLLTQPTTQNAMAAYRLVSSALAALSLQAHADYWVAANTIGAQAMLLVPGGSVAVAEQCARRAAEAQGASAAWTARARISLGCAILNKEPPDPSAAVRLFEEALAVFGDAQGLPVAEARAGMAEALLALGDADRAGQCAARASETAKRCANKWYWAHAHSIQARALSLLPGHNVSDCILQLQTALTVLNQHSTPVMFVPAATALATALLRRATGPDDDETMVLEDLTMAGTLIQAVAHLQSQAKQPLLWARSNVLLGDILHARPGGSDPERLLRCYGSALQYFDPVAHPLEYARCSAKCGAAYRLRTVGEHVANIESAIKHLRDAVKAITPAQHPADWANAAVTLAEILEVRPQGQRKANLHEAVALLRKSVAAYAGASHLRYEWGATALLLAAALHRMMRRDHLAEAAAIYLAAQEVFPVESNQKEWTLCVLGASECLVSLDEGDAISRAVLALEEALTYVSQAETPVEWARAQVALGRAYLARDLGSDVLDAISLLTSATKVFSKAKRPQDWGRVQTYLGKGYASMGRPDEARRAYDSALAVFTARGQPEQWRELHELMAALSEAGEDFAEAALHKVRASEAIAVAEEPLEWASLLESAGRLYMQEQRWQPAVDCLQQALSGLLKWRPKKVSAWASVAVPLAMALLQRKRDGDVDNALALLNEAIDGWPEGKRPAEWGEVMAAAGVAHAVRASGVAMLNAAAATACFEEVIALGSESNPLLKATTQLKLALHIVEDRPDEAMVLERDAVTQAVALWGDDNAAAVEATFGLATSLAVRLAELRPANAVEHLHQAIVYAERAGAAVLGSRIADGAFSFEGIREAAGDHCVCYLTGTHDEATVVVLSPRGGVRAWRCQILALDRSLQQLEAGNAAALDVLAKALSVSGWGCEGRMLVVADARLWKVPISSLTMSDGRTVASVVTSVTRVPSVVALDQLEADHGAAGVHVTEAHEHEDEWDAEEMINGLRSLGVGVVRSTGSLVLQPTGHRREAVDALMAGADTVLCCDRPSGLAVATLIFGIVARQCCAAPDSEPAVSLHNTISWLRGASPENVYTAAEELGLEAPPMPISPLMLAALAVVGTGIVRVSRDDTSKAHQRDRRPSRRDSASVATYGGRRDSDRRRDSERRTSPLTLATIPGPAPPASASGGMETLPESPPSEPEPPAPAAAPAAAAAAAAAPPAAPSAGKKAMSKGVRALRRMSAASMLITAHNVSSSLMSGMTSEVSQQFERAMALIQQDDETASEQAADILDRIGPQLPPALRKQVFGTGSAARTAIRDALHKAKKARALLRACTSSTQTATEEARSAGIEQAIAHLESATRVITREAFPKRWAGLSHDLGSAYACRKVGDDAENAEAAVRHLQNALELRAKASSQAPVPWASTCSALASALARRARGDRDANLEEAIRHWKSALSVYTQGSAPDKWARVAGRLAVAYDSRTRGDPSQNAETAIDLFERVLTVYTKEAHPVQWASTTMNLAIAVENRIEGVKAENLSRATALYRDVLTVTTREADPLKWARTTANLAVALQRQDSGDSGVHVETAIELYRGAIEVLDEYRSGQPNEWASAIVNLGTALVHRGSEDDKEEALRLYRDALAVFTPEGAPEEWARTASATASAVAIRSGGEKADNLATAISLLQRVLTVYTRDRYPGPWATTCATLGRLQRESGNVDEAAGLFRQALEVHRQSSHPAQFVVAAASLAELLITADGDNDSGKAADLFRRVADTVGELRAHMASTSEAMGEMAQELCDVGVSAVLFLAARDTATDEQTQAWLKLAQRLSTEQREAEVKDLVHWLEELNGRKSEQWKAQAHRVRAEIGQNWGASHGNPIVTAIDRGSDAVRNAVRLP